MTLEKQLASAVIAIIGLIMLYYTLKNWKLDKKLKEKGYKFYCEDCKKGFKTKEEAENHKCLE